MDTHNLATVIAPNILCADSKDPGMDESFLAIEAVHMLIDYNDQMCEVSFLRFDRLYISKLNRVRSPKTFSRSSMIMRYSRIIPTAQRKRYSNAMATC